MRVCLKIFSKFRCLYWNLSFEKDQFLHVKVGSKINLTCWTRYLFLICTQQREVNQRRKPKAWNNSGTETFEGNIQPAHAVTLYFCKNLYCIIIRSRVYFMNIIHHPPCNQEHIIQILVNINHDNFQNFQRKAKFGQICERSKKNGNSG